MKTPVGRKTRNRPPRPISACRRKNFDYDEFTKREFGKPSPKPQGLHWVWWLAGIAVLAAIIFTWIL
jgi:hypothetical protein